MNDSSSFPPPITTLVANLFLIDAVTLGAGEHGYDCRNLPKSVEKALGDYLGVMLAKKATLSAIYACSHEYWEHFLIVLRARFSDQPIAVRMNDHTYEVSFTEKLDAITLRVAAIPITGN